MVHARGPISVPYMAPRAELPRKYDQLLASCELSGQRDECFQAGNPEQRLGQFLSGCHSRRALDGRAEAPEVIANPVARQPLGGGLKGTLYDRLSDVKGSGRHDV